MEKCWGQWRESQYFLYRLTNKFIIRFLQLYQLGQLSKNIKSMECGRVFWLFSISTAFINSTSSQSYNSLSKMYIFKLPPQKKKKKKNIYIYIYIIYFLRNWLHLHWVGFLWKDWILYLNFFSKWIFWFNVYRIPRVFP